jgi:hypothetical protein
VIADDCSPQALLRFKEALYPLRIDIEEAIQHLSDVTVGGGICLAGSLLHGFATSTSDVDLLAVIDTSEAISSRESADPFFRFRDADSSYPTDSSLLVNRRLGTGHKLQIRITSVRSLEEIQDGVSSRLAHIRNRVVSARPLLHRKGVVPQANEWSLLHAAYSGLDIAGAALLKVVRDRLPPDEIAQLLTITRAYAVKTTIEDLEGIITSLRAEQRKLRLLVVKHRLLFNVASMLVAATGKTTMAEKTYLEILSRQNSRVDPGLVAELLERLSDPAHSDSAIATAISLANQAIAAAAELSPLLSLDLQSAVREGVTYGLLP